MNKNSSEPPLRSTFNINIIKEHINLINIIIKDMINEGNYNILDHELKAIEKYPEFYESYPFLVKKVCKGDDLGMLETMFKNLEIVESGKESLESIETNLGQKLASQYLKPVIKN